jgi:hypothetical protein
MIVSLLPVLFSLISLVKNVSTQNVITVTEDALSQSTVQGANIVTVTAKDVSSQLNQSQSLPGNIMTVTVTPSTFNGTVSSSVTNMSGTSDSAKIITMIVTKEIDKTMFVTVTNQQYSCPKTSSSGTLTQGPIKIITITQSSVQSQPSQKTLVSQTQPTKDSITVITLTGTDFSSKVTITLPLTTTSTPANFTEMTITQMETKTVNTNIMYVTLTSNLTREQTVTKTNTVYAIGPTIALGSQCFSQLISPQSTKSLPPFCPCSSLGSTSVTSSVQRQTALSSVLTIGTVTQAISVPKSEQAMSSQPEVSPFINMTAVTYGSEVWFKMVTVTPSAQPQLSSSSSLNSSSIGGSITATSKESMATTQTTSKIDSSIDIFSLNGSKSSSQTPSVMNTAFSFLTLITTQSSQPMQQSQSVSMSSFNQLTPNIAATTTLQGQVITSSSSSSFMMRPADQILSTIVSPLQSSLACSVVMTWTPVLTLTSKSHSVERSSQYPTNPIASSPNPQKCEECRRQCDPNLPANMCCVEECAMTATMTSGDDRKNCYNQNTDAFPCRKCQTPTSSSQSLQYTTTCFMNDGNYNNYYGNSQNYYNPFGNIL